MAEPLSSLIRPQRGPVLPALERMAPPPPEAVVAAQIEAHTTPGDIVVDLHGRGGFIARSAINRLRRVYDIESSPLTRLVAEVVLRPPDLRHLDAAVNSLAVQPRGRFGLRQAINESFSSHCPTCGRAVVVEEFVWEGDAPAPSRKSYRCGICRPGEPRLVPVDAEDRERAAASDATAARAALLPRFPVPGDGHALPDQLLDLYTGRSLAALQGIQERIESELRADSISAALRLAMVHVLLPASRLNSYPGRVATLRVASGRVRRLADRQWRERNPWLLFEEGCRVVRAFIQRIDGGSTGQIQARPGRELAALLDGSSNVVIRREAEAGSGSTPRLPPGRPEMPGRLDPRSRIRLVLTQPAPHWTTENLSFAYLATAMALGNAEAATLPLGALFRPPPRSEWAWDAAVMRRSLAAVQPVLAHDARVVIILDRTGPGGLVSGVLGGVAAGYRLATAVLAESGDEITGTLEFVAPAAEAGAGADASIFPLSATAGPGPVPTAVPGPADGPFSLSDVEAAVTDLAVAVLQARGEPARFERLLGEVLIGLDRAGHLRRLVGTRTFAETEERAEEGVAAAGMLSAQGPDANAAATAPGMTEAPLTGQQGSGIPGFTEAGVVNGSGWRGASPARSWRDPVRHVRTPMAAPADAAGARPGQISAAHPEVTLDVRASGQEGSPADESQELELPGSTTEPFSPEEPDAGDAPDAPDAPEPSAGPEETAAAASPTHRSRPTETMPGDPIETWAGSGSAADPVGLLLEIVLGELRRTDHPRLRELEPGRWWLRLPADIAAARPPLSDRLEWAVFSLLSTSGGIAEAAFFDRVAGMFRGHDAPDEEFVRACLDAYRSREPSADGLLRTDETLQARHEEHGLMVGMLAEYGHRLGLRCWISPREQRRQFKGSPLSELLSEQEQRVYLPLISPGDPEALEAVDCVWYLRGKATFMFEVEWTAMLDEPVLRRGARIPSSDTLVRFLIVPPERTELVRLKLARSPLLRERMDEDNWHILKSDHVRRLYAREEAGLDMLAPLLGLDPEIERQAEQLAMFG